MVHTGVCNEYYLNWVQYHWIDNAGEAIRSQQSVDFVGHLCHLSVVGMVQDDV